ncbi:MAG: type II toxin-antitoxin system RelE/ParE family toxin [Spirochaetes bacterium]|nr:type II toxin-antitoxin system RelE/ParE family toxin [Spirochaetota bacterium]
MIESFKDKETRKIWYREFSSRLPTEIQRVAYRKLVIIHRSQSLNDLRVPAGNRLEALSGKRAGQHSIRINQQWRVCFRWENGRAVDVEITDYH